MTKPTRRSLLETVGAAGIAVSIAGCTDSTNDETDETGDSDAGNGDSENDDSENADDRSELEGELEEVSEVLQQYEDYETALEDGYEFGGPYVPGMGWHFMNLDYLKDAGENGPDRSKPPILTYLETESGLTLGSAEYAVPADAVDDEPDLFTDEDAERDVEEEWHVHEAATHVFALGNGEQNDPKKLSLDELRTMDAWTEFHPPDESIEAGDTVSLNWGTADGKDGDGEERIVDIASHHPSIRTLHVWAAEENPNGVFAEVNPRFIEGEDDGHDHDH